MISVIATAKPEDNAVQANGRNGTAKVWEAAVCSTSHGITTFGSPNMASVKIKVVPQHLR